MEKVIDLVPFEHGEIYKIEQLSNKKVLRKYLKKEEILRLLDLVPPGKEKAMLITMWYTGIRVSEVINIKKRDIDFQNRTITIKWLKSRRYEERVIPFHTDLKGILELYAATLNLDDLLFPYNRQYVHRLSKKHLHTHPHTIRHSFAVNFLQQSKNPSAIVILKHLMGHKSINTTMEYLKIVPSDLAKELQEIRFT